MAKGLDALLKIAKESQERISAGDRPDVKWFKLEKSGDSKVVRFLQEIDAGSPNYREDKGQVVVIAEHSDPSNFRVKMKCSMDEEGRCYGCEQHKADPKAGWKAKYKLYTAVLVKNDEGDPEVQILSQTTTSRSIFNALVECAQDYGSITDRPIKIVRNGIEKDTTYMAMTKDRPEEPFDDFDQWEVPDIEKVATRTVAYDDQASFFNDGAISAPKADEGSSGDGWGSNKGSESSLSSW